MEFFKNTSLKEQNRKIMEVNEQVNTFGHPLKLAFLRDKKILKVLTDEQLSEIAQRYLKAMVAFYHDHSDRVGDSRKEMYQKMAENYGLIQSATSEQLNKWATEVRNENVLQMLRARLEHRQKEEYNDRLKLFHTLDKKTDVYKAVIQELRTEILSFQKATKDCLALMIAEGQKIFGIVPQMINSDKERGEHSPYVVPLETSDICISDYAHFSQQEQRLVPLFVHFAYAASAYVEKAQGQKISKELVHDALKKSLDQSHTLEMLQDIFFSWLDREFVEEYSKNTDTALVVVEQKIDIKEFNNPIACALLLDLPSQKEFNPEELMKLCLLMLRELVRVIHPDLNTAGNQHKLNPFVVKIMPMLKFLGAIFEKNDILFMQLLQQDFFEKDMSTVGREINESIRKVPNSIKEARDTYHSRLKGIINDYDVLTKEKNSIRQEFLSVEKIAENIAKFQESNLHGVEAIRPEEIQVITYEKGLVCSDKIVQGSDILKVIVEKFYAELVQTKKLKVYHAEYVLKRLEQALMQEKKIVEQMTLSIPANPTALMEYTTSVCQRYKEYTKIQSGVRFSRWLQEEYFQRTVGNIFARLAWDPVRKADVQTLLHTYYTEDKERAFQKAVLMHIAKNMQQSKILLQLEQDIDIIFFQECLFVLLQQDKSKGAPQENRKNFHKERKVLKEFLRINPALYQCNVEEYMLGEKITVSLKNIPTMSFDDPAVLSTLANRVLSTLIQDHTLTIKKPEIESLVRTHLQRYLVNNPFKRVTLESVSSLIFKFLKTHHHLYFIQSGEKNLASHQLDKVLLPELFSHETKTLKGNLAILDVFFRSIGNDIEIKESTKLLKDIAYNAAWNMKIFSEILSDLPKQKELLVENTCINNEEFQNFIINFESHIKDEVAFHQILPMLNGIMSSFTKPTEVGRIAEFLGQNYLEDTSEFTKRYSTLSRVVPFNKKEILEHTKRIEQSCEDIHFRSTSNVHHKRVELGNMLVDEKYTKKVHFGEGVQKFLEHALEDGQLYKSFILKTLLLEKSSDEGLYRMKNHVGKDIKIIGSIPQDKLEQFERESSESAFSPELSASHIFSKSLLESFSPLVIPGQYVVAAYENKEESYLKILGYIQNVK